SVEPVHGLTASVVHALKSLDTPFFVVMDGDFQHPPTYVGSLVAEVKNGKVLAVGTRLPYDEKRKWYRSLATWITTLLAKFTLKRHGLSIKDPMSGFFAGQAKPVQTTIIECEESFEGVG